MTMGAAADAGVGTMRGTVYTVTHELGAEMPSAVERQVLELAAHDPLDFERRAQDAAGCRPPQHLEFGPIAPPWRYVGRG
jgi:hypothetical protein